jgi:hypothetical protein
LIEPPNRKEAPVATDRTFQAKNAQERERMKALVGRMSDADLARSVGHGWTVAETLVHLAFWDLRAVTLIDKFEREGVRPSPTDVEVVNDAVREIGKSIAPRAAARLAVKAAEAVDRRIESLPDRLVEAVGATADTFSLTRHDHRAEHLEEIERALR